jgi:hypothetical protein
LPLREGSRPADNLSDWSPEKCTALPLDDRALEAARSWSRQKAGGY